MKLATIMTAWVLASTGLVHAAPPAVLPPGALPLEIKALPFESTVSRTVHGWRLEGVDYLRAQDLCRVLEIPFSWHADLAKLTFRFSGQSAAVTEGSEIAVLADGSLFVLPAPARMWDGALWVPLALVADDSGKARGWIGHGLRYDREGLVLATEGSRQTLLTSVRVLNDALGWKLSLTADGPIRYESLRTERTAFQLVLRDVWYDPLFVTVPGEHPWFRGLHLTRDGQSTDVSFSTGPMARGYRIVLSPDQMTLEVLLGLDERDVREGNLKFFSAPASSPKHSVSRIMLDPGHGDVDAEGELTQAICRQVADELMRRRPLEVIISHDRYSNPDPELRAARANQSEAGLFLSIHVHKRPGPPVAYVGEATSGRRGTPAELSQLGFRPADSAQEPVLGYSRVLAQRVLDAVTGELETGSGGIVSERIPELSGAVMPAVLLELGADPEGLDADRTERVVHGIVEGILRYLEGSAP